jgi:hypothetical protein
MVSISKTFSPWLIVSMQKAFPPTYYVKFLRGLQASPTTKESKIMLFTKRFLATYANVDF